MRVAFFLHKFPVVSETFVLRQITGLLDLGHDVHIYSERCPQPEDSKAAHPEVASYNLAARTVYLDAQMPPESGQWSMPVWPISGETWLPGAERPIPNYDRILQAVPTLRRCLAAAPELTIDVLDPDQYGAQAVSLESLYHLHSLLQRPAEYDVLHAHFGPVAKSFRFARALWNAPLVVTFHGYDFSAIPQSEGHDSYWRLFQDADGVMSISKYARTRLEELGCPLKKIRVLHTGVCPADFPYRPRTLHDGETIRLLGVGRLVEKKGFELAIRAIALVRRKYPNLRYDIIGDGPLRMALQQLLRELGLEGVVNFLGTSDSVVVRERLAEAHLFVLASVTDLHGDQEGIPVSIMEAQASGLPVLSTRHSGIPELVADGTSGFLVPERDIEALADRLMHLIEHSSKWPSMGREGRDIVEARFNITALNRELVQLYQEVCGEFASQKKCLPTTSIT